jgi:hypothetical protein
VISFLYQITPPLDVESVSQTLKQKNILPSALKFGFLGLGIMGSGIVKNLLNSGHSVIVWNRSPDKVRPTAVFCCSVSQPEGVHPTGGTLTPARVGCEVLKKEFSYTKTFLQFIRTSIND